jgi:ferredoxin-type protein NapF
MKNLFRKWNVRGVFALLAILFALPLGWGAFTGLSIWLSPFVMLNSVLLLKSLVWLNSLSAITLVLVFWRKRWFCHKICPLGWGCDLISFYRKGRGVSIKRMPPVGKWLAIGSLVAALAGIPLFIMLDPLSIFNSFFVVFSQELSFTILLSFLGLPLVLAINIPFPGIWCAKLCPLGGLQDEISSVKELLLKKELIKNRVTKHTSTGRRFFLASGAGLLGAFLLPSLIKPARKSYLRAPGSLPEERFSTLCLRCGSCIKSCPTGILKHHMDPANIFSWMVPEIDFINGYCLEFCNTCSQVCPSGAISLFSKEAKNQLFIGFAEIDIKNCLLSANKECDRCKVACTYDAIRIEPGDLALHMQPVVSEDKCVGCGACMLICPPEVIKIVP